MIKAKNNFVFIKRDEAEKEIEGLIIPDKGQEKPSSGTILEIGTNVSDKSLLKDKNKRCLFFKNNGFEIEYEGVDYLVVEGEKIIAVDEGSK